MGSVPKSVERVRHALAADGGGHEIVELPSSTRTAAEAAAALGCSVAQIAKSIVFRAAGSGQPVLVVASGVNRVNEARVAEILGEPIEKADAAFVREKTGFVIGGVAPVGHAAPIRILLDEDLLALGELWAAAGTPSSVFRTSAEALVRMTRGEVRPIK
jgi:prolyl-tRNA editing enzyme YbaK/EbsC (Cys-tRNA(Pro) deacylase)